jgi:hypothetical protein
MAEAEVVTSALRELGLAGAAIYVLLTTVGALCGVIVFLFRQNNKLNAERRAESAIMIKLIESNNSALGRFASSTDERNRVTQDLADAIAAQAAAFEMVNQRVGFYHEANTEKLKDMRDVVAAGAEAMRVNSGIVIEVRNGHVQISTLIAQMKAQLDSFPNVRRGR